MPNETCVSCKHFIGGGDYNLSCDLGSWLCYRNTPACDKYEFSQERIDAAIEQDKQIAAFIAEKLRIEPKEVKV